LRLDPAQFEALFAGRVCYKSAMMNPAELPNDIDALKAIITASEDRNLRKQDCIDRLEKLVADFKRALFGAKSEKVNPEQYELALEDIETALSVIACNHLPAMHGGHRPVHAVRSATSLVKWRRIRKRSGGPFPRR